VLSAAYYALQVEQLKSSVYETVEAREMADAFIDQLDVDLGSLVAGMPADAAHFRWKGALQRFINRKDKDGRPTLAALAVRGMQACTYNLLLTAGTRTTYCLQHTGPYLPPTAYYRPTT
jgi:hypothetical protein